MCLNNTKIEFIKLMEFKREIEEKIKKLDNLKPLSPSEVKVVDSQYFAYKAMLWEIEQFLLEWAEEERDKLQQIEYDLID